MTTYHTDRMMTGNWQDVPLLPENQQTHLDNEAVLATLAAMYTELKAIRTALLPPTPIQHASKPQPAHATTECIVPIHPDTLRYQRERRGWSQAKVAEAVGSNSLTV